MSKDRVTETCERPGVNDAGLPDLLMSDDAAGSRAVRRVVITGCVVNACLMVMKLLTGWLGHSEALVADGFHSLNDVAVDIVMLIFVGISYRKASPRFAYGYGKFETLASVLISVLMIFISIMIMVSGIESIVGYAHGEALEHPDIWTVFAVIVAMATKECLYHYYSRAGRKLDCTALRAAGWHHRVDAMSSIATLIGVTGAHFLGESFRVLDPCASLVIAVMILVPAIRLMVPTFVELMEGSMPRRDVDRAAEVISSIPGVKDISSLRTRKSGHTRMFDITVRVDGATTVDDGAVITGHIEHALCREFCPHIFVSVQLEPAEK